MHSSESESNKRQCAEAVDRQCEGYIDADNFLGGAMQLDRDAALAACARVDKPLGLDAEETAWGIREIALAETK